MADLGIFKEHTDKNNIQMVFKWKERTLWASVLTFDVPLHRGGSPLRRERQGHQLAGGRWVAIVVKNKCFKDMS